MSHQKTKPVIAAAGMTVALTSSLLLAVSPQAAKAYAAADNPIAQIKILKSAVADGTATPTIDKKALIQLAQPYCDSSRSKSC